MTANIKGAWALVTGASSGLGVDFAKELAKRGANVVIAARRLERLHSVRDEIIAAHGVKVAVVTVDLAAPDAAQKLYDEISQRDIEIDILVNNAGLGLYGEFVGIDWERERAMINVDITALTHLTKLYVRDMVARGRGYVLQVASIGAYQPSPLYASYAAAKSYVLNFSYAINYELRKTGVSVTVVSPGVTRTEFLQVAGQKPTRYQRLTMMQSPAVARAGINAMLKRKNQVVPGLLNAITVWSNRLLPRWLSTAVAYRIMR